MEPDTRYATLTIAGSDPSGGAGLQADLKTFSAMGVYGMAVPAALTVQNTQGVISVKPIPGKFIEEQLSAILSDVKVDAVKTGMLLTAQAVDAVAGTLKSRHVRNVVIDPLMVSSSGAFLLKKDALKALIVELFPLARLVMPNAGEASVLSGMEVRTVSDAREAAKRIRALGPKAVLIKGGHLEGEPVDVLYDGRRFVEFPGRRIEGKAIHGAGCVYSAAITAGLAKRFRLADAIAGAKEFVTEAIKRARPVGKGRVPLV